MESILEHGERQAQEMESLREMTPRIKTHYNTIKERMEQRQLAWGGDLSVLDEETWGYRTNIRRAMAFERVMNEMPIAIEDYDLIAGRSLLNGQIVRCNLPIFLKPGELGECNIHISHKCPDYETLLSQGMIGILTRLEEQEKTLPSIQDPDEREEKKAFIEGVRIEAEAIVKMANRYSELAVSKAEAETDDKRKAEWLEMARICKKVPLYPAESFREAIQSIWFVNYTFSHTMTYIPIGRIDYLLYPYFLMDFENGRIRVEEAQELVDSFCLQVNDRAQLHPKNYLYTDQTSIPGSPRQSVMLYNNGFVKKGDGDASDAINHWGQNILISGLNPDGSDSTSILTYLFLNAHEKISMTSPVLTVRMHKNSPKPLLDRVAQVLKTGGGMPFINNDDVIIDAYEKLGVPREDACNYANSNCWETLIQGMSNQEMIRGINFLYLLELALNGGKPFVNKANPMVMVDYSKVDPMSLSPYVGPSNPVVDGVDTGDASQITDFEKLMDLWRIQMDYMLKHSMDHVTRIIFSEGTHGKLGNNPLLSALTRDCIENIKDLTHMGARYNLWHILAEAVSNAADAAMAIKRFVFEEKLFTLPQLVEILKNDWAGEETLRNKFLAGAPKWGNGDAEVDNIAAEMTDYFLERVKYHAKSYPQIIFSPSIATFSWVISIGKRIGASADGRNAKELIAANLSPAPGRDTAGPTAAINSYMKIDTSTMAAGAPIDLRVSMNGLEGEEGTKRISALVETFLELGGNMMTLTLTSAEELRQAIEHPENYSGLRVRMGGWSAYFTLLSKESQKLHLHRVEHNL
ncbi:MAG TPA: pyruvate formate lyase family protein [Clostridia bacterium]|nr:pyruvate formate lyase family protein [Clostridia bacterium]